MTENLSEAADNETDLVVHSLNRLNSRGYDDLWIADYLSGKTGKIVQAGDIKKNDFTLANGDKIGWRSCGWMVVK